TDDDLKQYEADIEAMNLILISIPNDIYNSVESCQTAKDINKIELPNVTITTRFLNCLQPEWYKYITNVRLAKNVKDESYDGLFDYLQSYEKLFIASKAKKAANTHDPLALVAHTSSSSSRSLTPYYVTHPPAVVDYDDDYQGETFGDDQEDNLTSAMMLLACVITQRYSTPTKDRLHTSSNTRNQAIVQDDRVNIQSRNVRNGGRMAKRSYNTQEASAESSNVQKETGNVQRTL
nr:hypothetical protein [Tanacetum cinerariifolium]